MFVINKRKKGSQKTRAEIEMFREKVLSIVVYYCCLYIIAERTKQKHHNKKKQVSPTSKTINEYSEQKENSRLSEIRIFPTTKKNRQSSFFFEACIK